MPSKVPACLPLTIRVRPLRVIADKGPRKGGKERSRYFAWRVGIFFVEGSDELRRVLQVSRRLPSVFALIIAFPAAKVFEATVSLTLSTVQDFTKFVLFFTVDLDRFRCRW